MALLLRKDHLSKKSDDGLDPKMDASEKMLHGDKVPKVLQIEQPDNSGGGKPEEMEQKEKCMKKSSEPQCSNTSCEKLASHGTASADAFKPDATKVKRESKAMKRSSFLRKVKFFQDLPIDEHKPNGTSKAQDTPGASGSMHDFVLGREKRTARGELKANNRFSFQRKLTLFEDLSSKQSCNATTTIMEHQPYDTLELTSSEGKVADTFEVDGTDSESDLDRLVQIWKLATNESPTSSDVEYLESVELPQKEVDEDVYEIDVEEHQYGGRVIGASPEDSSGPVQPQDSTHNNDEQPAGPMLGQKRPPPH